MNNLKLPLSWNEKTYGKFIKDLKKLGDSNYQNFSLKLIPNTTNKIIGIKIPLLRKLAQDISKTDYLKFLDISKKDFIEEIFLQGLLMSYLKDKKLFDHYFNLLLPKIDNWATCDISCGSFKLIGQHKDEYLDKLFKLDRTKPFNVRVVLVIFLNYYQEEKYLDIIFKYISEINMEHYYVDMAIAWLLSYGYLLNKKKTLAYLKESNLSDFIYNKTFQKIIESRRVSQEEKGSLKDLKRRNHL